MTCAKTEEDEASIFSCSVASWLIQVLESAMSPEQVPSAEIYFSLKMRSVHGLMNSEADEYRGMTVI